MHKTVDKTAMQSYTNRGVKKKTLQHFETRATQICASDN